MNFSRQVFSLLFVFFLFSQDAFAIKVQKFPSGTPVEVPATSGTLTAGNCVQVASDGKSVEDAGATCGGVGAGDSVTVNTTAATDANFLDNIYLDWSINTVSSPDDITAKPNYNAASGDVALLTTEVAFSANGLVSEGTTADTIEGRFAFPDWATSDKVITFQDATDVVVGRDTTDTLTNKTIAAGDNVVTADDLICTNCIDDTEVTTHAGTALSADLEEEVTEGSLANDTILEADLKAVDAAVDEECLTYETTTGDFEWQTCGGGSDTNAQKVFVWPASATLPLETADSIPPITKDAGTNVDQLAVAFDDSTDECRTVNFEVPPDVASGTVTFHVKWYSAAATSGSTMWDIRHNGGVAEGVDPDQALTTVSAASDAAQRTPRMITVTSWTETIANLGWAASDQVDMEVCRDGNGTAGTDNLVGDALATQFSVDIPRV